MLARIVLIVVLITAWGETRRAHAHDTAGTGNERLWTHASGRHQVEGSFVAVKDGQVQVRRHDGALLDIKLDALSREDRQWVRDREAAIVRVNAAPWLLAQNRDAPRGQNVPNPRWSLPFGRSPIK